MVSWCQALGSGWQRFAGTVQVHLLSPTQSKPLLQYSWQSEVTSQEGS